MAIVITVDGKPVEVSDEEVLKLAKERPDSAFARALRVQLSDADRRKVDLHTRLTAEQLALVGADNDDQWTPQALLLRWKASRDQAVLTCAAELEIALVVSGFRAEIAAAGVAAARK